MPPTVGQPSESPVPGEDEWTTAKPRGTHVVTWEPEMPGRARSGTSGPIVRVGGVAPISCCTFQNRPGAKPAVPAKYGLVS